jgi:hypothetical protein
MEYGVSGCRHKVEVESILGYLRIEGGMGVWGRQEVPLPGDSGEHRGHGIPDLGDDPEQLEDEATAHDEGQNHWILRLAS